MSRSPLLLLLVVLTAFASIPLARGDDDDRHGRRARHDHDAARAAVERGEVRPLAWILNELGDRPGGEVVEVEFEEEDGRYVYEFEVITPAGRLEEVVVDAASGRLLEREAD